MDETQNSRTMLPLFLAFFIVGSMGTYPASALPELQRRFAISVSGSSLLYVVWALGIVVGSSMAARAVTRFSPGTVLACAAIVGAFAAHPSTSTHSYTVFLMSYTLLGLVSGAIIATGHGLVGRNCNVRSASNISALDFALSLGAASAPLLVSYFGSMSPDAPGWHDILATFEIGLGIFTVAVAFTDFGDPLPAAQLRSRRPGAGKWLGPILFWFPLVSCLYHAFEYGHTYWFVTYGATIPGIGTDKARQILAGFLSGVIVARMVLSWLSATERLKYIISIAVPVAVFLVVFMPGYTSFASLYVANVVFGLAIGAVFPSLLAITASTSDNYGAVLSSLGLISGALGTLLSALLLGAIIQWGEPSAIYTVLALLGIPLLIAVHVLVRHCLPRYIDADVSAVEQSA